MTNFLHKRLFLALMILSSALFINAPVLGMKRKAHEIENIEKGRDEYVKRLNNNDVAIHYLNDPEDIYKKYGLDKIDELAKALSEKKQNPLHFLASKKSYDFDLYKILKNDKRTLDWINQQDKDGFTPLMIAAGIKNNYFAISNLLASKANPNLQNNAGETALGILVKIKPESNQEIDSIKLLLYNGADPSIKNNDGKTPSDIAEEVFRNDPYRQRILYILQPNNSTRETEEKGGEE